MKVIQELVFANPEQEECDYTCSVCEKATEWLAGLRLFNIDWGAKWYYICPDCIRSLYEESIHVPAEHMGEILESSGYLLEESRAKAIQKAEREARAERDSEPVNVVVTTTGGEYKMTMPRGIAERYMPACIVDGEE